MQLFFLVGLCVLVQLIDAYNELDSFSLKNLHKLSTNRLNLNSSDNLNHFMHLNKTRVPGSKESIEVQNYITNHFQTLDEATDGGIPWEVELDNFQENGYNFTNLVFSKDPVYSTNTDKSTKYIVIAAHYDSLIQPKGFIGAIDSAVSCGILLDLAESISQSIDDIFQDFAYDMNIGIKFVFFDGEEAIERWSPEDSIYGARHLFSKWKGQSIINQIELFLLLDLLGAPDVNYVPSYFSATHDNYNDLSLLENKLIHFFPSLFDTSQSTSQSYQNKFLAPPAENFKRENNGFIEDDHIPFWKAGVPVLHLIPDVFPKQWHTIDDDFNHVDLQAIQRWNMLLTAYILEYLEVPEIKQSAE